MSLHDTTIPHSSPGLPVAALRAEVVQGPDTGKSMIAAGESLTVGTAEGNSLVLTDPTVSRHHLDLIRKQDRILVVDHGSTNGTSFSGVQLDRAWIPPGTVLQLGKTGLRVVDAAAMTIEVLQDDHLGPLYGKGAVMRQLLAKVRRAGPSNASVLVVGETGTGKELVARTLHEVSLRADGPFETVDCGAVLPTIVASELFGHEQGAFTGADGQHIGAFERANGGTLFLDEVGELPPSVQIALLGAIERRSFRRVGGTSKIDVDVRVVCATNRDLRNEVNRGGFRSDLYYRLAVVTIALPSLRERLEDLPLLAERFFVAAGGTGPSSAVLTSSVLEAFSNHGWPGNVRELRNAVEALLVMGEVPLLVANAEGQGSALGSAHKGRFSDLLDRPYNEARAILNEEFEGAYLHALLGRTRGNVSQAARDGQINRSHLTRLVRKHGLGLRRPAHSSE